MKTNEVKSAARILDLLELLSIVPQPMRLSDIARQMTMPKSSALALLTTLAGRGYVDLGGDGYVVSERFQDGDWISGEYGLMRRAAVPIMSSLASTSGESCFLAVPAIDWQVQYIKKTVSDNPLRYDIALPMLRPAHSTSVGRVMLADQTDDVLRLYLTSGHITKVTDKTVTDPEVLFQAIANAREVGHAMTMDSSVLGASGVAAPIRGILGATIGALCVIAPTPRFDAASSSITQQLRDAAAQISAQLSSKKSSVKAGASASLRHTRWTL